MDLSANLSNYYKFATENIVSAWQLGARFDPWFSLVLFIGASLLMLWRLGAVEHKGLEGTVLGTLIMPYASGFSNLVFAYMIGRSGESGVLVLENCLVNNVTNFTLLIGLPALIWGLNLFPEKKAKQFQSMPSRIQRLNRLSLMLTLVAAVFFSAMVWVLLRDQTLDVSDGLVLIGVFVFWQIFHVFDVLKQNIHRGRSLRWSILLDIVLVILSGAVVFKAIDQLVAWIPKTGSGWLVFANVGWLSGILMTLPNAIPAIYYAKVRRADIVYSSQIGDGHICIPMCIGLTAIFTTIQTPEYATMALAIIAGVCFVHLLFIALLGRLPRLMGLVCVLAYGFFLYQGVLPL